MKRFFTIALIVIAVLVVLVYGDVVVNTPTGTLSTTATFTITWSIEGASPTIAGTLKIRNKETNEEVTIDDSLDLTKLSKQWKVSVTPGVYIFVINDGSGEKFSGDFKVINGVPLLPGSSSDGTPAAPAAPAAPAPTAPAGNSPPAQPAGNSPAAPPSPAAKPSPNSGASNSNPQNNSPAVSSSGSHSPKSTSSTTTSNTNSTTNSTTNAPKTSSASTISASFFGFVGIIVFYIVQFI
ncbi:hypothetical protein F8M41_016233 [Gigaspora margarita]|uniref:Uncharacterized protein n=1 Tax=Gigaspora margarita TaxID=4874 RepID=A0A8H4APP5_GIGMA|nr:hypothetical protein F8M41_016233 [Gigaspora margarita]